MGFKKKSYPVHPRDLEAFAKLPVCFAILIDASYMTHWPHTWTREGNRSRQRNTYERRGYDADQVVHEAMYRLNCYGRNCEAKTKPRVDPGVPYQRLGRMRGQEIDAEEGDLA